MKDVREIAGADLTWARAGYFPAAFTLLWNDTEVGTLASEGLLTSRAIARSGDLVWRIRRGGIRHLIIEDALSGDDVASIGLHLLGSGELEFLDGRRLDLRRTSFLPPAWTFQDPNGSPLVAVRGRVGALLRGGFARIEPAAATLPEAALVALLGVYILVRRARRRGHS